MERLDRFMARANAAYYANHDPFADFITSPEISQAFGEVLGLWAAVAWQMLGSPAPVMLVEAGPGRGTLMADALRAVGQAMPAFRAALSVHLVETSPRLRAAQAARVPDAVWHDALEQVPIGPLILLANEFLDALPIRQFVRRGDGWVERFVAEGRFVEQPAAAPDVAVPVAECGIVERNEQADAWIATLAARLQAHPGAALILDYGPTESAPGDSLQAIAGGKPADPLARPGEADMTAHVDFGRLRQVPGEWGVQAQGPIPQGIFLARLGLFQRANRLAQGRSPAEAYHIMQAARRLGEPDRMGRLFKAMALASPGVATLPGFEDDQPVSKTS